MTTGDEVREFLLRRGLADEVVAEGAEGLVVRWEQTAREAEREVYPFGIEDWLDELDVRQTLHDLAGAVPDALGPGLEARILEADDRLRVATELSGRCLWGEVLERRMKWSPSREWWYWREPRAVEDDFEGGV